MEFEHTNRLKTQQFHDKCFVPLDEIVDACENCVHSKVCNSIRSHINLCIKQEYKFTCPVLVRATVQEMKEYEQNKINQKKEECILEII